MLCKDCNIFLLCMSLNSSSLELSDDMLPVDTFLDFLVNCKIESFENLKECQANMNFSLAFARSIYCFTIQL